MTENNNTESYTFQAEINQLMSLIINRFDFRPPVGQLVLVVFAFQSRTAAMTERTGPHQSLPESVDRFKHCTSMPCSQIIASLPDVVIGERSVGGTMMGIDAQKCSTADRLLFEGILHLIPCLPDPVAKIYVLGFTSRSEGRNQGVDRNETRSARARVLENVLLLLQRHLVQETQAVNL